MTWRDSIAYWAGRAVPFAAVLLLLAAIAGAILFVPARGAAALLGIAAGAVLGLTLASKARHTVKIAMLWAAVAVAADAAYARLNDQAPVTLASALAKIIDALVKLADPLIRGLYLTAGDPRVKVGAVSLDFVWALILTLIVMIALGFPGGGARKSR